MNNDTQNNEIVFSVSVVELQNEAVNRIWRELTEDELNTAKNGIESGLSFDIETVFAAAIDEAVEENQK